MAKAPFTPDGVKTKQTELYALDQASLNREADRIATQLVLWVQDNFTLTTSQDNFLSGMGTDFTSFIAAHLSLGVRHKLPIRLIQATPPEVQGSKRVELSYKNMKYFLRNTNTGDTTGPSIGEIEIQVDYNV